MHSNSVIAEQARTTQRLSGGQDASFTRPDMLARMLNCVLLRPHCGIVSPAPFLFSSLAGLVFEVHSSGDVLVQIPLNLSENGRRRLPGNWNAVQTQGEAVETHEKAVATIKKDGEG